MIHRYVERATREALAGFDVDSSARRAASTATSQQAAAVRGWRSALRRRA